MLSIVDPVEARGSKRARTAFVGSGHTKRPINKELISIQQAGVDATDVNTVLLAVTFPCTVTGLRWSLSFTQDGGTSHAFFYWAIVVHYDGTTVDTISTTDGASFYQPEKNVLVFGVGVIDNNTISERFEGTTKTMRKMQAGDKLAFIMKGSATNTTRCDGCVQYFCKT